MQSRRDQVQAYFFVVGRLVASVTHGRPDALTTPHRRTVTGVILGALLTGLLLGVFGIYGLFVPGGNTAWRTPGAIVLDADSGARYLYLDGQLRPVLNYASARLASGNTNPLVSVSASSLTGAPVGQPIGIPGAPDAVPAASRLDPGAWTVCAGPPRDGSAGSLVSVALGRPPGAGLTDAQALVVATPNGARYLIWDGSRHRITDATTLSVLGYGQITPAVVTDAWLNPVPAGRDLAVPPVPGVGRAGPALDGRPTRIGQVFEQRDAALGTDQLLLMRADGLAPMTPVTAALTLASPSAASAYAGALPAPIPVDTGTVARAPVSRGPDLVNGLPARPPRAVTPPAGSWPCVRYVPSPQGPPTAVPEVRPAADAVAGAVPVARHRAGTTADLVSVPAGSGALVQSSRASAVHLVTDNGNRFPLQGDEVVAALGYSAAPVVSLPQQVLDLLPAGPPLSTQDALRDASS